MSELALRKITPAACRQFAVLVCLSVCLSLSLPPPHSQASTVTVGTEGPLPEKMGRVEQNTGKGAPGDTGA